MNASRTILLKPRALPKVGSTTGPHKQSQNNFFVASNNTTSSFAVRPSAKAIHLLLGNIGVGHRASLHTIECIIRNNSSRNNQHGGSEESTTSGARAVVTADDMIDLIAQIRSIWKIEIITHSLSLERGMDLLILTPRVWIPECT